MSQTPPPPPSLKFCPHAFDFGATLSCGGDFFPKKFYTVCREKKMIGGQGLAVTVVSKLKVKVIFIFL